MSSESRSTLHGLIVDNANQAVAVAKTGDTEAAKQFVEGNIRDHLGAATNSVIKAIVLDLSCEGKLDEKQNEAYRIICELRESQ